MFYYLIYIKYTYLFFISPLVFILTFINSDLDGNVLMFIDFTNWEKEKISEPDFVRAFMYIVERASEKYIIYLLLFLITY